MSITFPEQYHGPEKGILSREGIYMHAPSPFARENLFFVRLAARYVCIPPYQISRNHLDSYLMFYIRSGRMAFSFDGTDFEASAGDIILLDCSKMHHYHALEQVDFYWFHFHGMASGAYFRRFLESGGILFKDCPVMEQQFILLLRRMQRAEHDEGILSVQVHRILAQLETLRKRQETPSAVVENAKEFIRLHYTEKLSMEDIAAAAAVSASHLTRLFRKETDSSPYNYLMEIRLRESMRMLLETPLSIEEIAGACAFYSAANYIRCFRQTTGMTPGKFRQMIGGMTSAGR